MQCFSLLPPPGAARLSGTVPKYKGNISLLLGCPFGCRYAAERRKKKGKSSSISHCWSKERLRRCRARRRGARGRIPSLLPHSSGFGSCFKAPLSVLNLGAGACGRLGPVAVPWSRSRHLQQQVLLSPLPSTTQIYHTGEEKQCRELLLQHFEVHAPASPCPMVQMSPGRVQPINHAQGPAGSSLPPPGAST